MDPLRPQSGQLSARSCPQAVEYLSADDSTAVAPGEAETAVVIEPEVTKDATIIEENEKAVAHAVANNADLHLTPGVKGHYYVVAGAFGVPENAVKYQQKLIAKGHFAVILNPGAGKYYKVCLGDFGTLEEANQKKDALSAFSTEGVWILKY